MDTWTATVGGQTQFAARSWVPISGQRHPALLAAALLAAGVMAGDWCDWPVQTWAVIAIVGTMAVVTLKSLAGRTAWPALLAGLLLVSLGAWRITLENSGRPSPALATLMQSQETVEVVGRLAESPVQKPAGWRAAFDLVAVRTTKGHVPVSARALLTTRYATSEFHSGDLLVFPARAEDPFVQRNPGGFDYAEHLYRQGIDALLRPSGEIRCVSDAGSRWSLDRYIEPVRRWIRAALSAALPKPAGGLILGFLLGDTDRLPQDVINAFRDSGTLHLLAVSGANVWLVVGLLLWPMRMVRIPRRPRTLILILVVITFSFLTRNEPSVVRASLMVATVLAGRLIFRPPRILNALGVSALLILIVSPAQLFRPGFQLSYAAVIGIALVMQFAEQWKGLPARGWLRGLILLLLTSTAATLVTAPIVARHFSTVPAWSIFANLCMIPLAAASLYAGLTLAATSLVSAALSSWIAFPVRWIIELTLVTAGFFAKLPGAQLAWPHPSWLVIIHFYFAAFLLLNWRHRYRWVRPAAWYSLALAAVVSIWSLYAPPRPSIILSYLDTGPTRVAAYMGQHDDALWLIDSPEVDDGIRQWVMGPFTRSQSRGDVQFREAPWRWLDSSDASRPRTTSPRSDNPAPLWKRYVSSPENAQALPRVWGEQFARNGDTVFCLRDFPTSPPGADWLADAMAPARTVVLPGSMPFRLTRSMLERVAAQRVVFFGGYVQPGHEEQWLERWRAQFPTVQFWSTAMHGGIMIEWRPASITIVPTVTDAIP